MIKKICVCVGLLVGLTGCSDTTSETGGGPGPMCEGALVEVQGEAYCVFEGEVIVEEGFECPPSSPHLNEFDGLGICASEEGVSEERLGEVRDRYEEIQDEPNNDPVGLPEIGEGCEQKAPLLINVEPREAVEAYIVLFEQGEDVRAQAEVMAGFYGFEITEVFTIIPAFSAELSLEVVEAIRCVRLVVSVEQSRTDTPPPDESCRNDAQCREQNNAFYCAAPNDPNVCGIPPQEFCAVDGECGEGSRCHSVQDSCSPDGVGSDCGQPCGEELGCGDNFVCDEGACRPRRCDQGGTCLDVQVCDPETIDPAAPAYDQTNGCVFVACQSDGDCGESLFCVKGICQQSLGVCSEFMAVP